MIPAGKFGRKSIFPGRFPIVHGKAMKQDFIYQIRFGT